MSWTSNQIISVTLFSIFCATICVRSIQWAFNKWCHRKKNDDDDIEAQNGSDSSTTLDFETTKQSLSSSMYPQYATKTPGIQPTDEIAETKNPSSSPEQSPATDMRKLTRSPDETTEIRKPEPASLSKKSSTSAIPLKKIPSSSVATTASTWATDTYLSSVPSLRARFYVLWVIGYQDPFSVLSWVEKSWKYHVAH